MHVSAARAGIAIDRLSTQEKAADGNDPFSPSGQSASTETGHTETLSVSVTLSQAAIESLNGATSQNSTASMQLALSRMDQIIRSGNNAAKADAGVRVENLKAQMRQLMEMKALMSPKALAAALAQMARDLAAAVSEYVQSGGSAASAAIGTVVLSASADPSDGPATAAASTASLAAAPDQDGTAIQQTDQQTQDEDAVHSSSDSTGQTTGEKSRTPANDSDLFEKDVRSLADQMKGILNEIKNKKKKGDLQSTQGSLEKIDQMLVTM